MKLGDLLNDYTETKLRLQKIRETTAINYRAAASRFPLSSRDVKKLTAADIEKAYGEMLARNLAPSSVRLTHSLLVCALDKAVRDGVVVSNAARLAQPPGHPKKTAPKALSDEDLKRLLAVAALEPMPWGLLIRLAIGTGLRRGEICAIKWTDVDLPTGTIRVSRATAEHGRLLVVGAPKSLAGVRTIILPSSLAQELRALALTVSKKPPVNDYVLGRFLRPSSASRGVARILSKAKLSKFCLHSLRHTHATALVSAGEPLPAIARRMGHSTVSTTMSIYAHPKEGEDKALAGQIDKLVTL